jgi:2'-5' RNA ligase
MDPPASVEGDERLRLFVGFRLPEQTLDRLAEWGAEHLSGRVVPRGNLHVTLAFLGTTPRSELAGVAAATASLAGLGPYLFSARRYRETRSVGMLELVDETGNAGPAAEELFGRLEGLGVYRREQRAWLPHVTVLRFRQRPGLRPPVPDLGRFGPSEAAVYHSVLRSTGAQYEVLDAVELGG